MELGFPSQRIQTTLTYKFFLLAKEHHIPWSEALRVGISIILAEKGVVDYDNKLNFMRRIEKLSDLIGKQSQEIEELKSNEAR